MPAWISLCGCGFVVWGAQTPAEIPPSFWPKEPKEGAQNNQTAESVWRTLKRREPEEGTPNSVYQLYPGLLLTLESCVCKADSSNDKLAETKLCTLQEWQRSQFKYDQVHCLPKQKQQHSL